MIKTSAMERNVYFRSGSLKLSAFGVATECGFGRRPSFQDVHKLIKLHGDIAV
jgi:hypothetical protein